MVRDRSLSKVFTAPGAVHMLAFLSLVNAGSGEAELDQQTRSRQPAPAFLVNTGGYLVSRRARVGGTNGARVEGQRPYSGVCRKPGHDVDGELADHNGLYKEQPILSPS